MKPVHKGLAIVGTGAVAALLIANRELLANFDEPTHVVLKQDGKFEIRRYEPVVAAEVFVNARDRGQAANDAFNPLFAYISGENRTQAEIPMTAPVTTGRGTSGTTIPMTAPVTQAQERDGWRVRFFLPDTYTVDTAPAPLNQEIALVQVPARTVVSIRFSGLASQRSLDARRTELQEYARERGLTLIGEPVFAQYNSPFVLPFLRRNEWLWRVAD